MPTVQFPKKRGRNKIKRFRQELRLRQLDLARKLNVYQSEVSEIERGERLPSVVLAKRISKVLRKSVEEIF